MQETKLTEPVQVGLWYQAKAGFITQIDFVETRPDGDFFLGNNGVFYNEYGETTYDVEHDLIRCLGADPFKQETPRDLLAMDATIAQQKLSQLSDSERAMIGAFPERAVKCGDGTPAQPPSTVKVFTPDYPTQFERIFTEVLGGAYAYHAPKNKKEVEAAVHNSIITTQEAIKQLKEIEGA